MRRFAPLMIAALLTGCSLFSPKKAMTNQLENVAKDWCLTMRASQVLCVYPLSEDVQVGDIYLVNTSIPNQVKQYVQNGFLPFDMLLTGGTLVDVGCGEMRPADIGLVGPLIASVHEPGARAWQCRLLAETTTSRARRVTTVRWRRGSTNERPAGTKALYGNE